MQPEHEPEEYVRGVDALAAAVLIVVVTMVLILLFVP